MRCSTTALRSSTLLAIALLALGVAGTRTHAQEGSGGGGPAAPARQGLRIRFAAIDGQAGVDGNAFLLFSSRRISLDTPASPCSGGHVVRAEARGSRGLVRKVELTLHLRGRGELPIRADGCPRAELRAELEDGTVLTGGEGTVAVQATGSSPGDTVAATYSWTATRGGAPFPMRGEFNFHLP